MALSCEPDRLFLLNIDVVVKTKIINELRELHLLK